MADDAKPDLRERAAEGRASLVALLRGLTPDQRVAPSLCDARTARDIVTHMVGYDDLSWASPSCSRAHVGTTRPNRP